MGVRATVLAVAAVAAALCGGEPAEATSGLRLKSFLVGHLEANTDRFVATGARGSENVHRTDCLLFVFNRPVDFGSVNARTLQVGIPTTPGLHLPADGSFYRHVLKEFDPVSGAFIPKKVYRNRILFDPTSRWDWALGQNPSGFTANSTFDVTLPGLDSGTRKTLKSERGRRLARTFRTTFRTLAQ